MHTATRYSIYPSIVPEFRRGYLKKGCVHISNQRFRARHSSALAPSATQRVAAPPLTIFLCLGFNTTLNALNVRDSGTPQFLAHVRGGEMNAA